MNNQNQGLSVPFFGALVGVSLSLSASVSAQLQGLDVLNTTNGSFSVSEMQFGDDVLYFIDILNGGSLGGVIFSFDGGEGETDPRGGLGGLDEREPIEEGPFDEGPGSEGFVSFSGESVFAPWGVSFMSEESWNEGVNIQMGGGVHSTLDLGSFGSLFGLDDNYAVLYSDVLGGNAMTELNDVDGLNAGNFEEYAPHFVRYTGEIATNGLFFDGNGVVIGSTVPEPTSALLVALGSLVLLGRRRS
ncbi:MAG: PEP-CTERM sorting domain-containing protein [Roseibacillus sp.]